MDVIIHIDSTSLDCNFSFFLCSLFLSWKLQSYQIFTTLKSNGNKFVGKDRTWRKSWLDCRLTCRRWIRKSTLASLHFGMNIELPKQKSAWNAMIK
jgi:hypothetical protein